MVKGAVGCNQFIVASLTDPPRGQALTAVTDPSAHQRVVALSLEAKETEVEGPVMAFAMYALPAIAGLVKVTSHAVYSTTSLLFFSSSSSSSSSSFFFLINQPIDQSSSSVFGLIRGVNRQL